MAIHTQNKPKSLVYKRAIVAGGDGADLQSLVTAAIHKMDKVPARSEPIESLRRLIGRHKTQSSMFFGELVLYEKDKDIAFIVENDTDFEIEQLNPANADGQKDKKREVLEGSLHFCIKGNNVIVSQTATVRARMLENHLNWLLVETARLLGSEGGIQLADEPTKDAKEKVAKHSVKRAKVGSPLVLNENVQNEDGSNKKVSPVGGDTAKLPETKRLKINPKAVNVLKAILPDAWDEDLMKNMDDANLHVTVEVKFNRKATDTEHRILDQIASAARHMEEEDTVIYLEDGSQIKGHELKLTHKCTVTHLNGIPDLVELYGKMKEWMINLRTAELIE